MPTRPFIPVPNTISSELFQNVFGQTLENYIWVRKDTPFTGADITSWRTALLAWATANWKPANCNNNSLVRVRTRAHDSPSAPMEDYGLPSPIIGNINNGGSIPSSNCIALKLSTGLTGRSNRGRLYLPILQAGLVIGGINGNDVNAAHITLLLSCYNALYTAIGAWNANAHWVVVSFMTGGVWRAEGSVHNVVSVSFVDTHIDCQRRRLAGRGI